MTINFAKRTAETDNQNFCLTIATVDVVAIHLNISLRSTTNCFNNIHNLSLKWIPRAELQANIDPSNKLSWCNATTTAEKPSPEAVFI